MIWCARCDVGPKKAPTTDVKGKVTLDGNPLPTGDNRFIIASEPTITRPIKDWGFSGQADGGKNRVEVALMKDAPPPTTSPPPKVNVLPPRYHLQTALKADIPAGGASDLKFDVESK